ncbi:hypothetical protein QJS66_11210 [Kocuria rhizophila]|nr:hypothetical protein QJS66_11210 [Kocuria rhizophila]
MPLLQPCAPRLTLLAGSPPQQQPTAAATGGRAAAPRAGSAHHGVPPEVHRGGTDLPPTTSTRTAWTPRRPWERSSTWVATTTSPASPGSTTRGIAHAGHGRGGAGRRTRCLRV